MKSWHAERADWLSPDERQSKSEKQSQHCSSTAQNHPTVRQLMDLECEGSLEGFEFDDENCRRAFSHYDKDRSGFLDAHELMKLAQVFQTPSESLCIALHTRNFLTAGISSRNCGRPSFPKAQNSPKQTRRLSLPRTCDLCPNMSDSRHNRAHITIRSFPLHWRLSLLPLRWSGRSACSTSPTSGPCAAAAAVLPCGARARVETLLFRDARSNCGRVACKFSRCSTGKIAPIHEQTSALH